MDLNQRSVRWNWQRRLRPALLMEQARQSEREQQRVMALPVQVFARRIVAQEQQSAQVSMQQALW